MTEFDFKSSMFFCMNAAQEAHFWAPYLPKRREELEHRVWEQLFACELLKDAKEYACS